MNGHHPSPWPAEDGGPTRRQLVERLPLTTPTATFRELFGACMVVLRDPGEVFVQGAVPGPDSTGFVERVDPVTLATVARSPDLPGGPWWPGGMVAHADGGLYVTHGRHVHRLDAATLEPTASVRLPRDHPYNSSLVLPDGRLVTKDFLGTSGVSTPAAGETGSELVVLAPGTLEVLARHELPEPSIARISATAYPTEVGPGIATVVVVGDTALHRITWDGTALAADAPPITYRHEEGRGHGWDAVLIDGAAWFLDDGTGSENFGPSFRGRGVCTAPLRLHRVPLDGSAPSSAEVCGRPGGLIANPPVVDPVRHVAIGYDSGNGVLTAFDVADDGGLTTRWSVGADHAGHLLLDPGAGTVLTGDFDHERGTDVAVLRRVDDGAELWRVDTHSPVQSVLFPAPGWSGDCYVTTFAGITRLNPTG
ncbi:MAG: hypothetical protein ACOYOP_05240 [Microthrixaceae bacterium]